MPSDGRRHGPYPSAESPGRNVSRKWSTSWRQTTSASVFATCARRASPRRGHAMSSGGRDVNPAVGFIAGFDSASASVLNCTTSIVLMA